MCAEVIVPKFIRAELPLPTVYDDGLQMSKVTS